MSRPWKIVKIPLKMILFECSRLKIKDLVERFSRMIKGSIFDNIWSIEINKFCTLKRKAYLEFKKMEKAKVKNKLKLLKAKEWTRAWMD